MVMPTRKMFAALLAGLVGSLAVNLANALDWPQRPVRFIYPFAAGSAGDSAARVISQRLSEVFKQQFIVENRVGASGTLAAEAVAHAPPDGYTFFWATSPQISITPALQKVPYDPVKDFVPVSAALTNSSVLIVNQKVPVKSVAEFIAWVKAQPEKLAYAQSGPGSIIHLAMEMFLSRAGLQMTPVGYKGNAPAMTDVIAGHVPTMFSLLGDALQQAKSGTIRMLAVTSLQRSPQAPDIPTVSESGFPGFNAIVWNGPLAPAGTPMAIVNRLAGEIANAVKDPQIVARLTDLGVEPLGNSPAELAAMIATEMPMWDEAVRIAGLKP
jgi:tripartite-type tricarboxylate transporter receptor subunit TctC